MGLLAGGLFLAAGTTHIPMLRACIAVFSALLLLMMLAVEPGFARSARIRAQEYRTKGRVLGRDFCFSLP